MSNAIQRLLGPYWRCRWQIDWLWPMFGHLIKFSNATAYCERCPWTERLDWLHVPDDVWPVP